MCYYLFDSEYSKLKKWFKTAAFTDSITLFYNSGTLTIEKEYLNYNIVAVDGYSTYNETVCTFGEFSGLYSKVEKCLQISAFLQQQVC